MFAIVPTWRGLRLGAGEAADMLTDNGYALPILRATSVLARRYGADVLRILNADARRRGYSPDWRVRVSVCPADLP